MAGIRTPWSPVSPQQYLGRLGPSAAVHSIEELNAWADANGFEGDTRVNSMVKQVGKAAKQVGKAGKQAGKAGKQFAELAQEVREARHKAEEVGKAIT